MNDNALTTADIRGLIEINGLPDILNWRSALLWLRPGRII